MIYLASPYSDPDPGIEQHRFDAVCQAAAALMQRGMLVFSPIAHSHPIARFGLPKDWAFWHRYDRAFLAQCDELWVLMLPGWNRSVGVRAEMRIAMEMGKPVRLVDPAGMSTENTPAVAGASHEAEGNGASALETEAELATLDLVEPAVLALVPDLTQDGRVERVGRRLAAPGGLPVALGRHAIDHLRAVQGTVGRVAFGQDPCRRTEDREPLGLVALVLPVTFAVYTCPILISLFFIVGSFQPGCQSANLRSSR